MENNERLIDLINKMSKDIMDMLEGEDINFPVLTLEYKGIKVEVPIDSDKTWDITETFLDQLKNS
jgi:hypothetical protein